MSAFGSTGRCSVRGGFEALMGDYLNHLTLNTGHVRRSPRSEVEILAALALMITFAVVGGLRFE